MKIVRITLTMLVSLGLLSFTVAAQMSHSKLKVGKKGEIVLKEPAKIGDTTLEPATYVVQHRVIGDGHYVRFQKLVESPGAHMLPTFKPTDAGVFACKLESVPSQFKTTMVLLDHDARDVERRRASMSRRVQG
jgi:hypothetical protein